MKNRRRKKVFGPVYLARLSKQIHKSGVERLESFTLDFFIHRSSQF